MADSEYQSGWTDSQVALPDIVPPAATPGGILEAMPKPDWSPENSILNMVLDPAAMADIDFAGTRPSDTPPWMRSDDSAASGNVQAAQSSPLTAWPVPGFTQLNPRDPQRGQGDGAFGSPRDHGQGWHTGIDITAPVGTPVEAAGDGTIANISPNPSKTYGNQIVIQHPDGTYSQYGHLSRIDVAPGTAVHAGDVIGLSGRSGNVPANADSHLHFEVRRGSMLPHSAGGRVVDPLAYLPPAS
jgi:murein DD-endopeptidase MepM/ murein hydrolase activator NlpD